MAFVCVDQTAVSVLEAAKAFKEEALATQAQFAVARPKPRLYNKHGICIVNDRKRAKRFTKYGKYFDDSITISSIYSSNLSTDDIGTSNGHLYSVANSYRNFANNYLFESVTDHVSFISNNYTTPCTSDFINITAGGEPYITLRNDSLSYEYVGSTGSVVFSNNAIFTRTVKDVVRQKVRQNLTVQVKSRAEAEALKNVSQSELIAIETLREMISEEAFRKYIKYGFILVKGQDGKVYQIYRSRAHTRVWQGGKIIEEICVRIKSDVAAPPTDNVIAFKTMIEADEQEFRKMGNVYKMRTAA